VGSARRRYDPFGAVSITAALLVFVYAISQAPQAGWAATQTVAMLCAAAALLAVFFVIETKVEAPLAWMTASVTSLAFDGLSQKIVTRTSPKVVMAFGMVLIGTGMLWATQARASGSFWGDLALVATFSRASPTAGLPSLPA
jgi:hypothetical protein